MLRQKHFFLSVAAITAVITLLYIQQSSNCSEIVIRRLSHLRLSEFSAATVTKQLSDSNSAEGIKPYTKLENPNRNAKIKTERASAKSCPGYWELRSINFTHPAVSRWLCRNQVPYKMIDSKFPLCEISGNVPQLLLRRLNKTAVRTHIRSSVTGRKVFIHTYPSADMVSGSVINYYSWEGFQVSTTLPIVRKFPAGSVTFVDIGCNIGVYSLLAREADIPTVAVDANIRNLLRIRMSANDMGWTSDTKLKLVWMFFHKSASLQYLEFGTGSCHAASTASEEQTVMKDTIPVMTGWADDLLDSVKTDLVVMKIGSQTSQQAFLSTGERLFREKTIVAVQMEFWRANPRQPASQMPAFASIVQFFTKRNYSLFSMMDLTKPLDLKTFIDRDAMWIRRDYLKSVQGK